MGRRGGGMGVQAAGRGPSKALRAVEGAWHRQHTRCSGMPVRRMAIPLSPASQWAGQRGPLRMQGQGPRLAGPRRARQGMATEATDAAAI